ncbi:MAG: hypothetical protein FJ098_12990, partial [Deltaproteobacteria bacterium]|nr:hypothetical protein [Deltaproteobacteria bacterium]
RACPSCGRETFLLAPQLFLGGIRVSREASPEDRRILADDRLALVRAELLADLVGTTSRVARRSPSSEKGEVFHGGDRPYRETLTWRARGDLEAESRVRARFEALPSLEPPAARLAAVLVLDPGSPASHAALRDALDLCRERPLRLVVLPVPDGHLGDGVSEAWQALRDAASSGRTWEALCAQAGIPGVPAGFKPREGRLAGTPPDDLLALAADLCDDVLSCAAPAACRDAQVGRLLHFARTLGVEGFGPRHMETLVDQGLLRGLPDLFRLRFEDLVPLDRMGEVLARKLLDEIQRARTPTLARFLASLGVDELAGSVSELLEREAGSLERVLALREAELGAFPQVNFTIAHQVLAGLRRLRPVLEELRPFVTLRGPGSPVAGAGPFAGRSFVFTGRMATLERKEAQARVRALGGLTPDGVVKGLDFLVVGDEGSPLFGHGRKGAKLEKAEAWGIRILSETEFLERLREAGATQEAGVVATRPDTE